MKKTTKSVFARILSLALVMALIVTSVVSSLAFTASAAETETESNGKVLDFESGDMSDYASGVDSRYEIADSPDGSGKALHGVYQNKSGNAELRLKLSLEESTTYLISYKYYVVAPTTDNADGYNTWHTLYTLKESVGNTTNYGKWINVGYKYETTAAKDCIILTGSYKCDVYYDDFTVVKFSTFKTDCYSADFETQTYSNGYPVVGSYTLEKDVDATVAKFGLKTKMDSAVLPISLKAGTSYEVKLTYKVSAWSCMSTNNNLNTNSHDLTSTNNYATKTMTFKNTEDDGFIGFYGNNTTLYIKRVEVTELCSIKAGAAENGSSKVSAETAKKGDMVTFTATPNNGYYFDYWKDSNGNKVSESSVYTHTVSGSITLTPVFVKNTNSSKYQKYDFDKLVPSGAENKLATVTDNNGKESKALVLNSKTEGNNNLALQYSLENGKQYKISYDYKGYAGLMLWAQTTDGYNGRQTFECGDKDSEYYLVSDVWIHRENVFTATVGEIVKLDIFVCDWLGKDGENIYFDNIVIEEYKETASTTYKNDFETAKSDIGQLGMTGILTKDPTKRSNYCYKVESGSYADYAWVGYKLVKGHTYNLRFDVHTEGTTANAFRIDVLGPNNKNGNNPYKSLSWATGPVDGWKTANITYKAEEDNQYFSFFVNNCVYVDNLVIVDLTSDGNYTEDFTGADNDLSLIANSNVTVTYEDDATLGKKVAVLKYPTNHNIENITVSVPYILKAGSKYRVKVVYTTVGWVCPKINNDVQGGSGCGAEQLAGYAAQFWNVDSTVDHMFSFVTNVSNNVVKISEIKIEKLTGKAGDVNNDDAINATDLTILTKALLGIVTEKDNETEYYAAQAKINKDNAIDILDFIALKKQLINQETITDNGTSTAKVYASQNIGISTSNLLGDESSFKQAVSDQDAYIIYKLDNGITEAAVETDISLNVMGDFKFEVSHNGDEWVKIQPTTKSREEINSNSWIRTTDYFGGLTNVNYFKITIPINSGAHIRTVRINHCTAKVLYEMHGYNNELRTPMNIYVSNSGNDNNSGLSENAPLKTLEAAFGRMLVPGDKILLKSGDTFSTHGVKIESSGTESAPITVTSYSSGNKPIITGFGVKEVALTVFGEYVNVSNLEFTSESGYAGIHFYALQSGATKGLKVENCYFHDINIVEETGTHDRDTGGVSFKAGGNNPAWFDGIEVLNNKFDNLGRGAIFQSTEWAGRDINQGWGDRNQKADLPKAADGYAPVYLSKNIHIAHNNISRNGGDAILLIGADGAIVEYNTVANSKLHYNKNNYVVDNDGNKIPDTNNNYEEKFKKGVIAYASIWCHSSDNVILQYNEVYGNSNFNNAGDLQAFDFDIACHNCVAQYNYSHDNDGGFMLLCALSSKRNAQVQDCIVRYNISVNDALSSDHTQVFDFTGSVFRTQVYNNTVYCGKSDYDTATVGRKEHRMVNFAFYGFDNKTQTTDELGYGNVFTNNIFYAADNADVTWGYTQDAKPYSLQNATFKNNVYYRIAEPTTNDKNDERFTNSGALTNTDPGFVNGGTEPFGRDKAAAAYAVTNSKLSNSGIAVANNGGKDYLGNTISADSNFIGAIAPTK